MYLTTDIKLPVMDVRARHIALHIPGLIGIK
jgi:hypothetical protein